MTTVYGLWAEGPVYDGGDTLVALFATHAAADAKWVAIVEHYDNQPDSSIPGHAAAYKSWRDSHPAGSDFSSFYASEFVIRAHEVLDG